MYHLNGVGLGNVDVQRDQEVSVQETLKANPQVQKAVMVANEMQVFITSGFEFRGKDELPQLCMALVRPL